MNAADTPTDVSVSITDAKSGEAVATHDGHLDTGANHHLTVHAPVPPPAYRVVATAGDRRAVDTLGGSGFHRLSVTILAGGIELHSL